MTSNYCEEKDMNSKVEEFHEQKILDMHLPNTILENVCSHCNEKLSITSVRGIGLCLNTRNFGEISLEVFCHACSCLETFYFREDVQTIGDFCHKVRTNDAIKTKPLTEEKMYSSGYNNIVQQMMLTEKQKEKKDDTI